MHYFKILYAIYMYIWSRACICTHDTHRHALITLRQCGGKVSKGNQKSPSECQFSMTCLIILMLAKDFYFLMREVNRITLMPSII